MASYNEGHFDISSISKGEKITIPPSSETNTEGQDSASSFHKRISAVWNSFERVMADDILKVKYKKYVKLYSCANSEKTGHLKRHQESHILSDAHLQSTLNIQGDSLVGSFAYSYENQKKILVKWMVKDELSFNLCEFFNFEEFVQLIL